MLRIRSLKADDVQLNLLSSFEPSPDSDDLSEETCAMIVRVDLARRSLADQMPFLEVLPHCPYPLPSPAVIQEEVLYMFNLLKSLSTHETSSQSPGFQEI